MTDLGVQLDYALSRSPPKTKDEHYNPKLHSKSDWEPPKACERVETAMDSYETSVDTAFKNSWKKEHIVKFAEKKIKLLKWTKKERKYIVIATDKNLGPAIMEIEYYIHRCLTDYLDKSDTYKELNEMEARLLNEDNFRVLTL